MKIKIKLLIMVVLAVGILIAGTACSVASSFDPTTIDLKETSVISAEELDGIVPDLGEIEDIIAGAEDTDVTPLLQLITDLTETHEISGEQLDKLIIELKEIETTITATTGMGELSLEQMIVELAELDEISAEELDRLIAELVEIAGIIQETGIEVTYSFGQATVNFVDTDDMNDLVTEVEEIEGIQFIPVPDEGANVELLGGIHGRWGVDDSDEHLGWLAGIYGVVISEDGTEYGFLGGIVKQRDSGLEYGYLTGKYADGEFWGTYYDYNGEVDGAFGGTYDIGESDVESMISHFSGIWESNDGEFRGYIEGRWAQKIGIKGLGKFGGKWFSGDNDPDVNGERPEADGKFRGHYAAMKLADDTLIYLFRGGWHNAEGENGKFAGFGMRSRFYGVWRGENTSGYMTGIGEDHRLRGVWGTFGEEGYGRLRGEYGPYPKCEPTGPEQELVNILLDRIEYLEERVAELERQMETLTQEVVLQ